VVIDADPAFVGRWRVHSKHLQITARSAYLDPVEAHHELAEINDATRSTSLTFSDLYGTAGGQDDRMAPMPRRHDWMARPVAHSFSTRPL